MDTVKFIEERNRMCKSFDDACTGCPAFSICNDGLRCCAVGQESMMDATAQIAIVEEWSATHPRKTRQSVFLEQYPETQIDDNGLLNMCPAVISSLYRGDRNGCLSTSKCCVDCRREFWMQEVEV